MLTLVQRATLEAIAERLVFEIKARIKTARISNFGKSTVDASGELYRSIRSELTDTGFVIYAKEYAYYLEYGRGPTRNSGDGTLRDRILQWIKDKGITPREGTDEKAYKSLAYVITRKIHREGTTIYKQYGGGKSGLFSAVINDTLSARIADQLSPGIGANIASMIIKDFNSSPI